MAGDGRDPDRSEDVLLRGLADKISAMLAYWDSSQRCRYANRAYERWFGVTPEALIGQHLSELLGPLYPLNLPYIERALRGEPQEFEREIPDPAGGPPRHSLASYIPDVVDGVVRGFFVIVTDISANKRAELALKASEARFSGIISISADAIISVDEDQRITMFNDGAEKIFGYTKGEALGARLDLLLPARLRELHRGHVATFAAGEATARPMATPGAIVVGLRKNGEEFPAEATISKLEVGAKMLCTVALRDITERRNIESEQQILAEAGVVFAASLDYRQTLDRIARLVVRYLADLCIIDMFEEDASLLRLTVVHADPAMASVCEELAALQLEPRHTLAWPALETKQVQVFGDLTPDLLESRAKDQKHYRLIRAIGPRSALVVPLLSGGAVLGALVLTSSRPGRYGARDVGLATELARRATLALENARLLEAERRARKARDEVLAIVAHDVRAPLSSILLAAESLENQLGKAGVTLGERQVDAIQRAVRRANRLIDDLLDLTRIEAGAFSVELGRVDARQVAADAVGSQRPLAAAASIQLQLEIDDGELPAVRADRDRLLQILENLIGNAIKFTPRGGSIAVRAAPRSDEIMFSVADTGPGIPAESLAHIFDRFWQANRTERRGAGLGLAICKGLIEAHGGRIWAESAAGHGSTFWFTIPAAPRASDRLHEAAPQGA